MHSLKSRLWVYFFITVALTGYLGNHTLQSMEGLLSTQKKIDENTLRRKSLAAVSNGEYNTKTLLMLGQSKRFAPNSKLESKYSDLIQAANSYNRGRFDQLLNDISKDELDVSMQLFREQKIKLEELQNYGLATIIVPLFSLTLILLFIRVKIFRSLHRLNRRMLDFLLDRYSFQFTEPEANELGDIQRVFNSLAQRVINNVDELKNLDQAKSEFLSIASHELRTPMTSIKGSLNLLSSGVMGQLDLQSLKLIKIAESETDRLVRLINDLLDLAKIEAGKLPLSCTWISWNNLMEQISQSLSGFTLAANVSIEWEAKDSLEVFIDRDRIQQVLTNLISNAVKFSPENGKVRVTVETQSNGDLIIKVIDKGPGIAPEDLAVIFQKFRQGAQESKIVKGTGLGLAIAKALVEEHGGDINVTSELGKGSFFYFSLPKWRDDQHDFQETAA